MDASSNVIENIYPQENILFLNDYGYSGRIIQAPELFNLHERHHFEYTKPQTSQIKNPIKYCLENKIKAVLFSLESGLPSRTELKICNKLLSNGILVWIYYPEETAVEYMTEFKCESYKNIWLFLKLIKSKDSIVRKLSKLRLTPRLRALLTDMRRVKHAIEETKTTAEIAETVQPTAIFPLNPIRYSEFKNKHSESGGFKFEKGVYLRLDFWNKLVAGGSYGHTCYVAKALNQICEEFFAYIPNKYELLDQIGVKQININTMKSATEYDQVQANEVYYPMLKFAFEVYKPNFIYERLCLGNYTGARLSSELQIPYIVEYNGSEISMLKNYAGQTYQFEEFYLQAEMAAFNQATLISVVSQAVKDELVARGVEAAKIIIIPNNADPDVYKPLDSSAKQELRSSYNLVAEDVVVGFIGTFGGWHGIDALAKALPKLCKHNPQIKVFLVGDGHYTKMLKDAVSVSGIESSVRFFGKVPQQEAVTILQACDIFLSPHTNTGTGEFFGSPTKLFEYMALGAGIVASDLNQIGEVMRPAITQDQLEAKNLAVTNQRGVLVQPGNVDQLVEAVMFLANNPEIRERLGANARNAILKQYNWDKGIQKLFSAENNTSIEDLVEDSNATMSVREKVELSDSYKAQVQNQWDNNPCGSQYVKESVKHTLDWYLEVEAYRYNHYAPWKKDIMGFTDFRGKRMLEVGAGIGTDLAQFAKNGALVTDLDLSLGHLTHAKENFQLRGLPGEFYQGDAEAMPFPDHTFDFIYSNGVIHHSPNTAQIVAEMWRVLKPGGKICIMVYAENSYHYWKNLVKNEWFRKDLHSDYSIGEIMSRTVEITENDAKPLVKVYSAKELRNLFNRFSNIKIHKRQLLREELPAWLQKLPVEKLLGRVMGWNLILQATKGD